MSEYEKAVFLHNVLVLANIFEIGEQAIAEVAKDGLGSPEDTVDVTKVAKSQLFNKMNTVVSNASY